MSLHNDLAKLIKQVYVWAGRPTKDGAKLLRNLASEIEGEHGINTDSIKAIEITRPTSFDVPSLEEYFEQDEYRKALVENLKTNIEVYCTETSEEEQAALLRMNLIMVRQCMEEYGVR